MLNQMETAQLEMGYYFNKKDKLGSGFFGSVYKINHSYVVKKVSKSCLTVFGLPIGLVMFYGKGPYSHFKKEIQTTKTLSKLGICPNIIKHSVGKHWYYVMEKMDITLNDLILNKQLTLNHINKLESIFIKVNATIIHHDDLHQSNIMWSLKLNEFRIIDWGLCSPQQPIQGLTKNDVKYLQNLKKKISKW